MNDIILLLVSSLGTAYLLDVWFNSTLKVHLFNCIFKPEEKLYTLDDLDEFMLNKFNGFFYNLLSCPTCIAFYISLMVSLTTRMCNGSYDLFVPSVIACAFLALVFYSLYNKYRYNDNPKEIPKPQESNKKTGIHDIGGYILDFDNSNTGKVIGKTTVYQQYAVKVFEPEAVCDFPECEDLKNKYAAELKALQEKFDAKGVKCPECNKASLRNKYYDIIKSRLLK